MTLPVEALVGSMRDAGLVVAVLLGFGFGFVLERAGFGRATKLAAQFYLYDMTVFKVMFGAIVTAMLGMVLFAGLGWLDLGALATAAASETFVGPMIVGGLLLGAGFIISGYCPGTSLGAIGEGRWHAVWAVLGMLVGAAVYAEIYPALKGNVLAWGSYGKITLAQILGVSHWLVIPLLGVVFVALFAFFEKKKV